jgi:hypothetical protein
MAGELGVVIHSQVMVSCSSPMLIYMPPTQPAACCKFKYTWGNAAGAASPLVICPKPIPPLTYEPMGGVGGWGGGQGVRYSAKDTRIATVGVPRPRGA